MYIEKLGYVFGSMDNLSSNFKHLFNFKFAGVSIIYAHTTI